MGHFKAHCVAAFKAGVEGHKQDACLGDFRKSGFHGAQLVCRKKLLQRLLVSRGMSP